MNKTLNKKKYVIYTIIAIFMIIFFFSTLILGDDRIFPTKDLINNKSEIFGIPIKIYDGKYDQSTNTVEIKIDFFVDQYNTTLYNKGYIKKSKLYYADPKHEADNVKVKYVTSLESHMHKEDDEQKKIVMTLQLRFPEDLKKNLGFVYQILYFKNQWNEDLQESIQVEVDRKNYGIDYRSLEKVEIAPIQKIIFDEDSKNYLNYLIIQEKEKYGGQITSKEDVAKEGESLDTKQVEEVKNSEIETLEEQKKMLQQEVENYQITLENDDISEVAKKSINNIIQDKEAEIESIDKRLKELKENEK